MVLILVLVAAATVLALGVFIAMDPRSYFSVQSNLFKPIFGEERWFQAQHSPLKEPGEPGRCPHFGLVTALFGGAMLAGAATVFRAILNGAEAMPVPDGEASLEADPSVPIRVALAFVLTISLSMLVAPRTDIGGVRCRERSRESAS